MEHAPSLLSYPGCQRLSHGARLRELASEAGSHERGGDPRAALFTWRQALSLLPAGSAQHRQVVARVQTLGGQVADLPVPQAAAGGPQDKKRAGTWGALGALALLLWKGKALILMLLSKAKWLFLGLSKGKTLPSMFAFAGIYWSLFGWWLALGLVMGIYIHEMGHVAALKRLGIASSPPMRTATPTMMPTTIATKPNS